MVAARRPQLCRNTAFVCAVVALAGLSLSTCLQPRSAYKQRFGCRHHGLDYRQTSSSGQQNYGLYATQNVVSDPYTECWKATSRSANPNKDLGIDRILQRLNSPAPQAFYAVQHALHKLRSECETHTKLCSVANAHCTFLIKPGSKLVLSKALKGQQDNLQAGVDWTLIRDTDADVLNWIIPCTDMSVDSVVVITHDLLDECIAASEQQEFVSQDTIDDYIDRIEYHIGLTLGADVRGRAAADAAFNLAVAGVTRESVYQSFTHIAGKELFRLRERTSRRTKDTVQVVEKLAAAGVKGPDAETTFRIAGSMVKDNVYDSISNLEEYPEQFDMLSPRPLLWLWRYSASQKKAKDRVFTDIASSQHMIRIDTVSLFQDPTKPLVLDIGCGLGVSLIGLACNASSKDSVLTNYDWNDCNFLGCDLSPMCVSFGQSIATRWGLQDRLKYVHSTAEQFVDSVVTNNVTLVMLQFPTPYRLTESGGNLQLPKGPESGFMASSVLLQKIYRLLQRSNGQLLLQTNCEDVAVYMKDAATACGFMCVQDSSAKDVIDDATVPDPKVTQRMTTYIEMGGKRAEGPDYFTRPILPDRCYSETEMACILQNNPVYRLLLKIS